MDLAPILLEFLKQQYLVDIVTRQAIRSGQDYLVEPALPNRIP